MNSSHDRDDTSGEFYTLEMVERITHISRDRILVYERYGLVPTVPSSREELLFDDEGIHRLRRIAMLLEEYEVNEQGLRVVASLLDEVERLRAELRFLRS